MSFPTVFANLPAGNNPASLLDTMYAIVGAQGAIPCTATGTNSYTLTPNTNYYQPASYQNFQIVAFVVPNSSTGLVSARLGPLAFINVYMPSGLQAGSGDLTVGAYVIMAFNAALNAGAGGFQVFNATTPSVIQPVQGVFKNLLITNSVGTPDTIISLTADEVMLENTPGGTVKVGGGGVGVNLSINTTTSGANGLDTGSMAANTFYSVWVIFNASIPATAGLISLSPTTPTLPSGYAYKARVGWVRTGAASTNLHRIRQAGRRAQYVVTPASQTTALPNIANGTAGTSSATAPVFASVAVQGANLFVPATASEIIVVATNVWNNQAAAGVTIAPNTNYAGRASTNPPPYDTASTQAGTITTSMELESANIFWASSAAGGGISCLGWLDNI